MVIPKGNENSDSEQLINNKHKVKRANSKEDMKNFQPKNISNQNNDKILNKKETKFKKDKRENFSANNSFNNDSKPKTDKIEKEEIEITISPLYENDDEDKEINYYNIRNYIENSKKRLEKKKINSQRFDKRSKTNTIIYRNNPIKKGMISTKNNIKKFKREKEENDFLFEDQQNDDSDDWGNYLNDLSFKRDADKIFLYTNSKNNTFNNSAKDSSDYIDSEQISRNGKNILKNNDMIFDYFQDKKGDRKDFLEKQLNRKRFTEIKLNRKKERIQFLERKNNYYTPKINQLSLEIIRNKGDYIPIFKRAIELENEKKMKILIKQKMKNKSLSLNNSKIKKRTQKQINEFFNTQINWKNKVEKENNILKLKLRAKENQNNTELNFISRLDKSELNISRRKSKPKSSFSLYDNNKYKSTTYSMYLKENDKTNIGYRLYKDYEQRQKNMNKLKKKLTPSFTPIINKSNPFVSRNYCWIMRRRNLIKSTKKSSNLLIEYDSSFTAKQQKSRNPKKVSRKKHSNSNIFPQPFNLKEINNNLKSTAVDSRISKSRTSMEIFGTKLEKINEYKDQDEDISSSVHSLNNISNKNTNSKIYKSNKNNKSISLELSKKLNTQKESQSNITYISEEKTQSKLENATNKSLLKETNSNKEEAKSIIEHKDSSKILLKEYNSGKLNANLKLDDIKPLLDLDQKDNNKESQTPTIGKNILKKNNNEKINLNSKSNFKKKSVQIKETKELKNDNNIEIIENKNNNDKNTIKNNEKDIDKNTNINKINNNSQKTVKILDNKNNNNEKMNDKNEDKSNSKNNNKNLVNFKSTTKINPFKKLFSKEKRENLQNIDNLNSDNKRSKSIFIHNKSNSSLSNKYTNEIENQPQDENTFKNLYDFNETNINQFNFEHKDSNILNDFLTNKGASNLSYKEENIIQNSSYNFEDEIHDSQNSLNHNIPNESKKMEKEIIKKYKIIDSEKDENDSEEEENEETEKIIDMKGKNEGEDKDKNFSWIEKLDEISRNEGNKSDKNIYNKRKTGGSTTRTQTKRGIDNNNSNINNNFLENFDENKLYMLNLRNSSSTGNLNPYTIVAKEPIFYKFFLKKSKHNIQYQQSNH